MQTSGIAEHGTLFWRRASRSRLSGVKLEGEL
jgi:hypothetical protein